MFFRCCIHQGLPTSGSLEILCGSLRRQWTLAAPDHGPVLGLGDWAATKLGKSSLKGNSPQGGGSRTNQQKTIVVYWFGFGKNERVDNIQYPPGKQHIHYAGAFEDDFPFLWVGYVSSLEGKLIKYSTKGSFFV